MKKIVKTILIVIGSIITLILIAGFIKFNFINDDVFIAGESATKTDLIGSWVEPIPGNEEDLQGFRLYEDGTAESINMATLLYKDWKLTGDGYIKFTVESIGNGTSSSDIETYQIESVNDYKLFLKNEHGNTMIFKKK